MKTKVFTGTPEEVENSMNEFMNAHESFSCFSHSQSESQNGLCVVMLYKGEEKPKEEKQNKKK